MAAQRPTRCAGRNKAHGGTHMKLCKRIQYNSPVVLTFAFLSLAALLLGYATNGWTTLHLFSVYRSSPLSPGTYIRLFGHVLGHADLSHYIGNMVLILVIGPPLEEKYGGKVLLSAILFTAVVSGAVHLLTSPGAALLGASGIVFMMILLSSLAGMRSGSIPLTLILVAVIYLGGEIADGLTLSDGVSHLTHIVGGCCGTGIGFYLGNR